MSDVLTQEEFDKQMKDGYDKNLETETMIRENKEMQAVINNAKLKSQKKSVERINSLKESLETEDITDRDFDRNAMRKNLEDRKNAVVFLNTGISKHVIIAPGSLVAIASMTSNGKSTLTAHITEAIIRQENKPVLVLSNEETEEDVRARVSCLRTGISFGDYKSSKCSLESEEKVLDDAEKLVRENKLIVISSKNEKDAYRVTTVDGILTTLKNVNGKVGAVVLDYYQNVSTSESGVIEPWHVNNELATELNIIKGMVSYPIIAMAQCKGITTEKKVEDKGGLDFDNNHPMYRWKGGQNLLTYATDILELVKDFNNSCSFLFAHKVRFGHGDLERLHMLPFDKKMQRFVEWSPEFDAGVTASRVAREGSSKDKDLDLGDIFNEKL